jgi:(2R)-sulfolactate sulfo-lyase subunit beta
MSEKIMGFRRPDGSVGVRNHVVILPVDDISNAAVEHVSEVIEDTLPLPHPYGRLQFGEDFDLFFRTIIGTGCNPNVAAVVVIGIEPNWTEKVVEGIAKTGKPVAGFSIERTGDLGTIEKAARKAKEFVHLASEMQREPVDVGELTISIKCGESDTTSGLASNPTVGKAVERMVQREGGTVMFGETSELTGGEQFVAERMKTEELKQKFMDVFNSYNEFIESKGVSLLGSQPTQGNIRGGLTTIEEKAMGNIQKIGNCQVDGVLAPAEAPDGKGLYFMDTSSAAAEAVTLFAAAGSVLHFFPTGQGNIVGHPVIPVVKLSANPLTVETMSEHIDLDVSKLLSLDMDLDEAGDALWSIMKRTLNGRKTAAEVLGHKEFVLTKLYRSA